MCSARQYVFPLSFASPMFLKSVKFIDIVLRTKLFNVVIVELQVSVLTVSNSNWNALFIWSITAFKYVLTKLRFPTVWGSSIVVGTCIVSPLQPIKCTGHLFVTIFIVLHLFCCELKWSCRQWMQIFGFDCFNTTIFVFRMRSVLLLSQVIVSSVNATIS